MHAAWPWVYWSGSEAVCNVPRMVLRRCNNIPWISAVGTVLKKRYYFIIINSFRARHRKRKITSTALAIFLFNSIIKLNFNSTWHGRKSTYRVTCEIIMPYFANGFSWFVLRMQRTYKILNISENKRAEFNSFFWFRNARDYFSNKEWNTTSGACNVQKVCVCVCVCAVVWNKCKLNKLQ